MNANAKLERLNLIAREIANAGSATEATVPGMIHVLTIACLARDEADDVGVAIKEAGLWLTHVVEPEAGRGPVLVIDGMRNLGRVLVRIADGERMGGVN